ncbi:hypothetical protein EJB05_36225 [Eragrostis curvula]|uniref:C3H1-type domain-containing protein n=1 Tax=Eragrostis curvula TaxID=38414 RepID=A0A5J9U9S7_9POAL|nr:hypothetical protein EJB05_36225 [Eragrostis curvula]
MASAGGRVPAMDGIREVEMERPPEEPARVGSKRDRDSRMHASSRHAYSAGFYGVTTSDKKAGIANHVHMNSDGTSAMGGRNLYGSYGERTIPDYSTLRSGISSPCENLGNKIKRLTKVCTLYTQGRCNKGNSCTFLHEREGPGSDHRWNYEEKAGLLTSDAYGNSRGSEEGSQVFKDSDGSKHQYRSFDLSIPSDPLQGHEKLSAYGGTAGNRPNTHNKEHLSSHASYSSYSFPGFKNPGYATSDHSFRSPTLHATSHLGKLSPHLSIPVIENVGLHKYLDAGTGTSRPALLASSSPQPSIVSPGSLSPIKDEVWVTSVPFVPSIDIPDIKTPSKSLYDPFVDYVDSPKDDNKNNLKSSSISSQHTNQHVATPKSLNHDDKLAKNLFAKGSNELACLIAYDRGRSSSLDDNNRVNVHDRKPDAASTKEKTREFRFRLAEHVKELIKPSWEEGFLSKDAHKLVVKKSIEKVLSSIEPHQVPSSEMAVSNYIALNKSKIEKLVKAYVDRNL